MDADEMLGDLRKAYKLWLESDPSSITEQRWATSLANQFHELDAHLSDGGSLPADWDVSPMVPGPSAGTIEEARRLRDAGQKIQAIKFLRNATKWGLKESKEFVDSL